MPEPKSYNAVLMLQPWKLLYYLTSVSFNCRLQGDANGSHSTESPNVHLGHHNNLPRFIFSELRTLKLLNFLRVIIFSGQLSDSYSLLSFFSLGLGPSLGSCPHFSLLPLTSIDLIDWLIDQLVDCSTGAWTQGLHREPLYQPFFVKGFLKIGFLELFAWAGFELWSSWSLSLE
jgi:hypothetical protein